MSFFFKKKSYKKLNKLFFATDVHGSERTFRKFINAGKFYDVNILILGGDITGKLLIPIIQELNGHYRATLQGTTEYLTTENELQNLTNRLDTLGFYYKIMSEDEFESLKSNKSDVEKLFHELAKERLENWVELAESRLNGTGIKCFVTGGNDDDPEVLAVINKENNRSFIACEGKMVYVDDVHPMISVGFSTPTPWNTPREVTDENLSGIIDAVVAQVNEIEHCIFNFHDPPVDSTLDTCPMLDWTKDPPEPIFKAGQMVMHGAGSISVRKAIETYQPMLGLHGHIHESQGIIKIGRTTCINPGSEYGEGMLRGCLISYENGEVVSYQMTSG
jgi:uncharacterized protein